MSKTATQVRGAWLTARSWESVATRATAVAAAR
jgi:hypothetical protein